MALMFRETSASPEGILSKDLLGDDRLVDGLLGGGALAEDRAMGGQRRPGGAWRLPSGPFLVRMAILLLSLLAVGVYVFNRIVTPLSLQGVINAPLVTLRAPIDGRVTRGGAMIGQTIRPSTEVFAVRDTRVDEHRLLETRARLADAEQRVEALDQTLVSLDHLAEDLRRRTDAYAAAEEARLRATLAGQETAAANARQTLEFSLQRERRLERLVIYGAAVEQRHEDAVRARLVAQATLDRALAEQKANRATLEAAAHRVFTQNGFGGAAYSQQKHDEIQVRRLELTYQHSLAMTEAAGLRTQMDAEAARVESLREVSVPSTAGGVVAAVYVSPGTDVLRGNPLADVMDCGALYVEATVSAGWFATPRPGSAVRVRLYGASDILNGRIRTLRDTAMALDPARGTPLSERESRQTLTVIIDLDPADVAALREGGCPVGQPASVRFQ